MSTGAMWPCLQYMRTFLALKLSSRAPATAADTRGSRMASACPKPEPGVNIVIRAPVSPHCGHSSSSSTLSG